MIVLKILCKNQEIVHRFTKDVVTVGSGHNVDVSLGKYNVPPDLGILSIHGENGTYIAVNEMQNPDLTLDHHRFKQAVISRGAHFQYGEVEITFETTKHRHLGFEWESGSIKDLILGVRHTKGKPKLAKRRLSRLPKSPYFFPATLRTQPRYLQAALLSVVAIAVLVVLGMSELSQRHTQQELISMIGTEYSPHVLEREERDVTDTEEPPPLPKRHFVVDSLRGPSDPQ